MRPGLLGLSPGLPKPRRHLRAAGGWRLRVPATLNVSTASLIAAGLVPYALSVVKT
ncbi:hypothetical protein P168DRAFT_317960 [Aspergillus campestris IBT 28561]|uniref:Uncharacterized protein n=1 Tax=Aspergillus campestris (strain IBT 28561) TaxID=1392248 RepID=A0A2I1D4X2_ASPC2|nr:uncharacterized protein P168DRAFT_317960 [Aspergillus campestris IBT 28561]PKY04919.1 hypothetical protein P168DRAFT_317960 [Aspergillus campestris IBT 28561]